MSGADIVKGSERVSSLGAHRFILFGVLHPPHQRFGVLFAFGVHFFKAGAVLGQGGHSLGAVRGDDADKALSLQLPRPLDSRVVPPCPAAQPLGCSGVMRLQQVCQMLVPGITTHQPDGLGQDESHPVAAVGKGPFQRDGVGQAAIKIRHAVDDAGLVDDRDAAGRHEDAVVVRVEVCLGEILRLAVLCISGHHAELCRAAGKRRVIQRILAACIAEGAVDIAQIEIGVLADEVVHAHVLPAEGVYRRIGGLIAIIPKDWKYLRGDIYYADMEPHIGSEQGGTRPVVVLQNDVGNRYAPTLIVATVTSRTEKKKYQPTHVLIAHNTAFEKPSVVQLEQIFTIDKSRIQRFLGQTTRHEMRRIEEALMNSLEINEWDRRNADE